MYIEWFHAENAARPFLRSQRPWDISVDVKKPINDKIPDDLTKTMGLYSLVSKLQTIWCIAKVVA